MLQYRNVAILQAPAPPAYAGRRNREAAALADAAAEITHIDFHRLFALYGADDDARFLGRMVDGVRQQIGDDPCNLLVIDKKFRNLFGIINLHETVETIRQYLSGMHGIVDQLNRLHDFGHEFEFT